MSDTNTRTCRVCGKEWPLSPEYFGYHAKNNVYYRKCNACRLKRWKPPTGRPPPQQGMKRCSRCENDFPETSEFFAAHHEGKNGFRPDCRKCCYQTRKKYRDGNPEARAKRLEQQRASYPKWNAIKRGNPKYLEKRRNEQRRNLKRYVSYIRMWRRLNPEKSRVYAERRRAAKLAAPGGGYTGADIKKLRALQNNRCWWCGEVLQNYQIDHRIALSIGGTDHLNNLVLSCPTCNMRKWRKLPHEFNGRLL